MCRACCIRRVGNCSRSGTAIAGGTFAGQRTILQKVDVPGTNLELVYATVEIAPGFKAGRHFHPGIAMALVFKSHHANTIDRFMALLMLLPPFTMTMSVGCADELLRR